MARTAPGLDRTFWFRLLTAAFVILLIAGIALAILAGSPMVALRVMLIILPAALAIVATCYIFFLFVVFVHELGHFLGGKMVGFHLRSFTVGPLEFHVGEAGKIFRVGDWRHMGGFVRMLPVSTDRLPLRFAIFVLAGPVISVAFALAMLEIYRSTTIPIHTDPLISVLEYEAILILCWMGFGILPGTLLPFTSKGGNATDMKILLTLLRAGQSRDRYIALLLLAREILAGIRARNWTSSYCDIATESEDGDAEEVRARLLAYYHGLDLGRVEYARAQLARAVNVTKDLGKKRGVQGDLALLEAALVSVLLDRDAAEATRKLEEAGETSEAVMGYRHAISAGIAALTGEQSKAEFELSEAREHFRMVQARYGGNPEFNEERLDKLRKLISG